jgi:hypothetical protein
MKPIYSLVVRQKLIIKHILLLFRNRKTKYCGLDGPIINILCQNVYLVSKL